MRIVQWIALALAVVAAPAALAQPAADFPTAPVKLLVPFAAGGPTDVVARILGELLSARWGGKTVVIDSDETARAVDFARKFFRETMLVGTGAGDEIWNA